VESKARVLVVDDDPGIREVVSMALQDEGYEVRAAENGKVALDILQRCPPAVILLDLMMPVMDGWTFRAKQLATDGASHIPVVVLSAGAGLQRQAATLGPAVVMEKPFDLDSLLDTVSRLVRSADP
jgi:CheY-like chemotaxis protein